MFIYKQYTHLQLNEQYNNRLQVPEYPVHFEKWEATSRETEFKYHPVKNISYGSHSRECLDIYPSQQPGSKTLVFIHGGYWKSMAKESFHFVAGAFQPYHITTVLVEYPLMPQATMEELVCSCRNAISWVQQNIHLYNGDASQVYVVGHSAGAHLATMLMTGSNNTSYPIKGVVALSGLFNLQPIRLSYINDSLQMNTDTVLQNSPVQLQPSIGCPLLLAVGEQESTEFKSQSADLYNHWKTHLPVQLLQPAGLNHFSIVEALANKHNMLHQAICEMMDI